MNVGYGMQCAWVTQDVFGNERSLMVSEKPKELTKSTLNVRMTTSSMNKVTVNFSGTPQPLYNTMVWVKANFRVSYPICVITRVKCIVK